MEGERSTTQLAFAICQGSATIHMQTAVIKHTSCICIMQVQEEFDKARLIIADAL